MDRTDLGADCASCAGLCCVAPAFSVSADFAIDKEAGHPCPNLQTDSSCRIHSHLRDSGFTGCKVYDCFGAGQKITQLTYAGQDWRLVEPQTAGQIFGAFHTMQRLHRMMWHLAQALDIEQATPLHEEVGTTLAAIDKLTQDRPDQLSAVDLDWHRAKVDRVLLRVAELVRDEAGYQPLKHSSADLVEANLKGSDLRGANMTGALLIGADLSLADLGGATLMGADLRAANLRDANLSEALFLTQSQLDAANGDASTQIPPALHRPAHWPK